MRKRIGGPALRLPGIGTDGRSSRARLRVVEDRAYLGNGVSLCVAVAGDGDRATFMTMASMV